MAQAMLDSLLTGEHASLFLSERNNQGNDLFLEVALCSNISAVLSLDNILGRFKTSTNKNGKNALHLACHNTLMVETLIELGVDPNEVDKTGQTPLMLALEQGENNLDMPILRKKGAENSS